MLALLLRNYRTEVLPTWYREEVHHDNGYQLESRSRLVSRWRALSLLQ